MPASLPVELNHDRMHEIRVVSTFETDGPFVLDLVNDGQPVHVHVNLDDELSRVASLDGGNHYVEAGTTEPVPVSVDPVDEPVTGHLTVATGYGAETAEVAVTVQPWEDRSSGVEVDENLSKPGHATPAEPADDGLSWVALLVAVVALVAAVAVTTVTSNPAALVGTGVVVGVVLAAVGFALR